MKGLSVWISASLSAIACEIMFLYTRSFLRITFTAYTSPVVRLRHRYTLPYAPLETRLSTSKSSMDGAAPPRAPRRRRSARATPEQSARPTPGRRRDPETGAERHHRRSLASRRDRRRLASATDDPCRTAIRNGIRCRSRRRRPNREESQRTRGATRRPDAQTGRPARRCLNPRRPAACRARASPRSPCRRGPRRARTQRRRRTRAPEETTSIKSSVSARSASRRAGSVADSRKRDFFVREVSAPRSRASLLPTPSPAPPPSPRRPRRCARRRPRRRRARRSASRIAAQHRECSGTAASSTGFSHMRHTMCPSGTSSGCDAVAKCAFASTCTSAPAFAL